ncbi:MAG TPA: ABC transporter substrate-binding protein [Gammaproteobacteria bacterium]|nr:ABC transporter substrate-binding protein [Gammaproteobacteria bacterium]
MLTGRERKSSTRSRCVKGLLGGLAGLGLAFAASAHAAPQPIRIGVLGPASHIDGKSIFDGAKLAAKQINAAGGIMGRPIKLYTYDDEESATNAVRAFQRAVQQDHVKIMIGVFSSEVALSVEPWAARLKTPFIITGAASTKITHLIHQHYRRNKYIFQEWINSYFQGRSVCDFSKDELVGKLGYKTAAVVSENAAWTKPLDASYLACLPKVGLKVLSHMRFSSDTNDFTPIFNKLESEHPNVMITGWAHVGLKATVQWQQEQVPILMAGFNDQAQASSFWAKSNGAAEGVITQSAGAPGAAVTPKSIPFNHAYQAAYDTTPAYDAYTSYDSLFVIKNAIGRAKSTRPNALVSAIEKTDMTGTIGHIQFYGKNSPYTHGLKYGSGHVQLVAIQWQHGKQVAIWPQRVATGSLEVPAFVKKH